MKTLHTDNALGVSYSWSCLFLYWTRYYTSAYMSLYISTKQRGRKKEPSPPWYCSYSYNSCLFLNIFGRMLCLLPPISLIEFHLVFLKTRFHILSYIPLNIYSLFYLEPLGARPLFMIIVHNLIRFLLELSSVSLLVTLALKRVTVALIRRQFHISANVTFCEEKPYFSPKSAPLLPTIFTIFPTFVPLPVSLPISFTLIASPRLSSHPPLLQLYNRRRILHHLLPQQYRSFTTVSTTTAISTTTTLSDLDLPIAIRKEKQTPCPYPMDDYVLFARLGSAHRAMTTSLSTISIPRTHREA